MNYISSHSLHGRAGHQLAEWNTPYVLARDYGLSVLSMPFNHGWEDQLHFNNNQVGLEAITPTKTIHLPKFDRENPHELGSILSTKEDNLLFILSENQNLLNHWPNEQTLKEKWKSSPCNSPWDGASQLGVHIRRGDVTESRYPNRWVSTSDYIDILRNILSDNPSYQINIFSEGTPEDFSAFEEFSPVYHLNGSEFESFNRMTKCEALVTGKSGFSYFASILSEGEIYAIPFWHSYPQNPRIHIL